MNKNFTEKDGVIICAEYIAPGKRKSKSMLIARETLDECLSVYKNFLLENGGKTASVQTKLCKLTSTGGYHFALLDAWKDVNL